MKGWRFTYISGVFDNASMCLSHRFDSVYTALLHPNNEHIVTQPYYIEKVS